MFINRRPVKGPWGGGNKTVSALFEKLSSDGHEVFFDFNRPDFDLIFCIDPRPDNTGIWYQHFLNYKSYFKIFFNELFLILFILLIKKIFKLLFFIF